MKSFQTFLMLGSKQKSKTSLSFWKITHTNQTENTLRFSTLINFCLTIRVFLLYCNKNKHMKIQIFGRHHDGKTINLNHNTCILKHAEYICIFCTTMNEN